jgi:dihydroorotase-like cyclic amidohydrolase
VQRAAYVAHTAGAPLYIVHTSSAQALEAALRHRRAGARVHIETCPHYLTHDIGWPGGDVGKINPPLRQAVDRDRLWQGLRDGEIDTVATDHVHRDISAKAGGIWAASPGCPGLETLLPVLLSEGHHKRGLPLERIVEVVATNPARILATPRAASQPDWTLTWRLSILKPSGP